jgi:hypothetical protein
MAEEEPMSSIDYVINTVKVSVEERACEIYADRFATLPT